MALKLEWTAMKKYVPENVDGFAPTEGGVYRVAQSRYQGMITFFVGQAENLRERLQQHLLPDEPNEELRLAIELSKTGQQYSECYFRCAVIANKADRDGAERALFDYFKPSANKTAPSAAPAEINIT